MPPARVCFCVDRWPTFYGMHGEVRYVQTLARGLVARGVEVHVVTDHPTLVTDLVEDGYHLHTRKTPILPVVSRWQPGLGESHAMYRAILELHRRHPFDVAEFTNYCGIGFCSTWRLPMPTVMRVHTTAFDALRLGIGRRRLELGYARLERWGARPATIVVTHTRTHQQQVALDYGIPADRIHIVPHGIAPAPPDRAVTRRPRQVVCVGAATPRKGIALFIEAAAVLARSLPDVTFVWAGKDNPAAPGGRTWGAFAIEEHPHLRDRFELRVGLSDAALSSLYAESGLYLCTSRYESFGLTLAESMLASLPVAAPRTAAMAELIRDGENGFLFDPDGGVDAVVRCVTRVLGAPAESAAVAARAREIAAHEYGVETMTSRMLDLYRLACAHGRERNVPVPAVEPASGAPELSGGLEPR